MPSGSIVLPIALASDGTNIGPDKAKQMRPVDGYFCDRLGQRWMEDRGEAQPGRTYTLERLPAGYHGFEQTRGDSKHIDRFVYGHPNGFFRSLNELYPHFKHLQTYGRAAGCSCKLCIKKSSSVSVSSSGSSIKSAAKPIPHATKPIPGAMKPVANVAKIKSIVDSPGGLPYGRLPSDSDSLFCNGGERKKQADEEGSPDAVRALLDKLEAAGEDGVDEAFVDQLSPDWRVGHDLLQGLLADWQALPKFVPRIGEIVLFTRSSTAIARIATNHVGALHVPLTWEAGVVTQMPIEPLSHQDLYSDGNLDQQKHNVVYSGFRVEPLLEIGNEYKGLTRQHKYVPIYDIRPFSYWNVCIGNDNQHPTIRHALTIASSFCIIGKYSFKGVWPDATLFASSIYIGPELIMLGDVVKLAPLDNKSAITDIMLITSIRLNFVDLDRASSDDYDNGKPYITVLHIGGKAFTLDPKRSFAGMGKMPAQPGKSGLPDGLGRYGQWFHMVDPARPNGRLEVPFHRLVGRCYDEMAMRAWFPNAAVKGKQIDLSQDLAGVKEARTYSSHQDRRIVPGKCWHWADTRTEQLDLHEINGMSVGVKDEMRSPRQISAWQQALKVMDGRKGAVEQWYAAEDKRLEEEKVRRSTDVPQGPVGIMGRPAQGEKGTTIEQKLGEPMQLDDGMNTGEELSHGGVIDLIHDDKEHADDEDESMSET